MANELRASTAVAIDFPRTGVSDLPWPAGNPPAGSYRVIGTVADLRRSYRGQGGIAVHAHTITVRDQHGRTHTVAITRPASEPPPRIGTDLRGELRTGGLHGPELQESTAESPTKEDQLPLPNQKTSREGRDPRDARVLLSSPPKVGKTTLLSQWAPDTTLILDTHKGTALLDGEHYVQPITTFAEFESAVDEIVAGQHQFRTIGIDLVEDVWKMADRAAGATHGNKVAAGLVEYGKGMAEAEGTFRRAVDKLLTTSYGVWFITHVDTVQDGSDVQYVPRLDKRVKTYIEGATDFVLIGETGSKQQGPVLHTRPTPKFQAGSRVPLPEPLELDARKLYVAIAQGLAKPKPASNPPAAAAATAPDQGDEKQTSTEQQEKVAA